MLLVNGLPKGKQNISFIRLCVGTKHNQWEKFRIKQITLLILAEFLIYLEFDKTDMELVRVLRKLIR